MNTDKLKEIKDKLSTLATELEVIADNIQQESARLDEKSNSTFETNQQCKLRAQETDLRRAVKRLTEADELIFDVMFP